MALSDSEVISAVEAQQQAIADTVGFVHAHPELGHEENECAAHVAGQLAAAGLEVEERVAGLDTAFRAVLPGARDGRRVGIVVQYDAVAQVREDGSVDAVHSCGHGPIAGPVLGAALALASLREQLAGELVVVGCPADEIHAPGTIELGGGKGLTADAGVWDDCDAALYAHPEFIDTVSQASLWMRRDSFRVSGSRSLRDDVAQPQLDAIATLLQTAAGISRSNLMIESLVLDGDVEEGTGLVLAGTLLYFGEDQTGIDSTSAQLRAALPDAAWEEGRLVPGIRPDDSVTAAVAEAFGAAGRGFEPNPPTLPFATDFGNISRRVPAALIGVGRADGWSFHSDEGAAQFASADGIDAANTMATVLALAVARLSEPPA
jgi:metal-dependent amidase/aminoacylase/carboxypeptidase family protein